MAEREKRTYKKIQAPENEAFHTRKVESKSHNRGLDADRENAGDITSGYSFDDHVRLLGGVRSSEQLSILTLQLQRTYGNAYVQRLLKSTAIQARLSVSNPGDPSELEAERVSEGVMNILDSPVKERARVHESREVAGTFDRVERQEEEEEEVQTAALAQRSAGDVLSRADNELEERINNARSSGEGMAAGVRQPMEEAFGADFSGVKIHTDANADSLNRALQAQAFTTKQDVFFKEGYYQPETVQGRKLIAHELTHVVQQSGRVPDIERAKEKKGVALPLAPKASAEVPDLSEVTVTRVKMKIKAGKKQEAIDLILAEVKATKFTKLDQLVGKTIKYDKDEPDIGGTYYNYDPATNKASNIGISIGEAAFSSVSWLYSTMCHEHLHAVQMFTDPKKWDAKGPLSEFVAWGWEIFHAAETGVIKMPAKMKELGAGLKSEAWDGMSTLEKALNIITYHKALKIVQTATAPKK